MSLAVSDLHVAREGFEAVRGITLAVEDGTCLGVIGPNGAGKSSMVLALAGVIPSTGTVCLDGRDVSKATAPERVDAGLATVPESKGLFPKMRVEDILLLADGRGREGDWTEARVLQFLPFLRDRLNVQAGNLSGGERQLLAIAKCLLLNPRILIIDEPSAGLAPVALDIVAQTLSSLVAEGIGLLLVEQNIQLVSLLSDAVMVINQGTSDITGGRELLADHGALFRTYMEGLE